MSHPAFMADWVNTNFPFSSQGALSHNPKNSRLARIYR
jgi:hypothetical protein